MGVYIRIQHKLFIRAWSVLKKERLKPKQTYTHTGV